MVLGVPILQHIRIYRSYVSILRTEILLLSIHWLIKLVGGAKNSSSDHQLHYSMNVEKLDFNSYCYILFKATHASFNKLKGLNPPPPPPPPQKKKNNLDNC